MLALFSEVRAESRQLCGQPAQPQAWPSSLPSLCSFLRKVCALALGQARRDMRARLQHGLRSRFKTQQTDVLCEGPGGAVSPSTGSAQGGDGVRPVGPLACGFLRTMELG